MSQTETSLQTNPLLDFEGLPAFGEITHEHVVPAVREMLAMMNERIEDLEANLEPTWDGLLKPLEDLGILIERVWNPVGHLLSVRNTDELRKVHEQMQPEIVAIGLRLQQSRPIYEGLEHLRNSAAFNDLDEAQQRIVEQRLRDARLAGVALEGKAKERFLAIARELSQLSTDFSNHVLDATKAFELIITHASQTEGWPTSLRRLTSQSYNRAKETTESTPDAGPWRITLDFPCFQPFMEHTRDRALRHEVFMAFVTRASSGKLDNTPLIDKTLELRKEMAALLGFNTYAELSLATKMAPDVAAVEKMFEELAAASRPHAQRDLEALVDLNEDEYEPVMHWDVAFLAERLREKRFDYTDEQLRPYFPLPRVLDGLFDICHRLFGISVRESDDVVSVWHPDVKFYNVLNEANEHIASFYLDPYARPSEKRGGAWVNPCIDRRWIDGKLQLPVIHICCNGTPPVGDVPSLMSFSEVTTLFHEFGHALQGMLTTIDYADAAGLNGIEWDAVELASQFMENWCYHKPALISMTRHVETGEPLPDDLFDKLCAARTFRAGSAMVRQLQFGVTDMTLHHHYDASRDGTPFDVHQRVEEDLNPLGPLPQARFLCAFSHIFAGGYAAGYYSYKWAEVLSADAFAAFEEAGLDDENAIRQLGRRFRDTVLALGGGRHPMDVFKDFRGREPSTNALLRHNDLDAPPQSDS